MRSPSQRIARIRASGRRPLQRARATIASIRASSAPRPAARHAAPTHARASRGVRGNARTDGVDDGGACDVVEEADEDADEDDDDDDDPDASPRPPPLAPEAFEGEPREGAGSGTGGSATLRAPVRAIRSNGNPTTT